MLPNHCGSCLPKMFIAPELRVVRKVIHPAVVKSRAYLVVGWIAGRLQLRRPAKLLDHFGRLPSVSSPDLPKLAVRIDERGGQAVRDRAALGLDVNGEALRELVDFSRLASRERPDLRICL